MNFVSSHHWTDHIDLIEGEPDAPERQIFVLCLLCWHRHAVGRYRYDNDPIDLEDGTTTTHWDWFKEIGHNRINKSKRRKMYCPRCDLVTDHVAEL